MEKISINKYFGSPISMSQRHLENIINAIKETYGKSPSLKFSTSDGTERSCDSPEVLFKNPNLASNKIEEVSIGLRIHSHYDEGANPQEDIDISLSFNRGFVFDHNIVLRMSGESEGNLKNVRAKIEDEIKAMRPFYGFIVSAQNFFVYLSLFFFLLVLLFAALVALVPRELESVMLLPAMIIGIILFTIFGFYYRTGVFQIGKTWERHQLLTKVISALFPIVVTAIISSFFIDLSGWLANILPEKR